MWTIKSDECLELHNEEDEVIAKLIWSESELSWKLHYGFSYNFWPVYMGDVEGFGKLDIEPVERAAVETIIDYCKERAEEWGGRAEDAEALL